MRAFVAIPLPEPARDELARLQSLLRVGRPTAPEQFHVTLAFFEDVPEHRLADLDEAIAEIAAPAFEIALAGLDVLGQPRPRVLAARVAPNAALENLHERLQRSLRRAGFDLPRRRFRPHVTLARFRDPDAPETARALGEALSIGPELPVKPFPAEEMTLVRSVLGTSPPRHDVLARYPLAGLPIPD